MTNKYLIAYRWIETMHHGNGVRSFIAELEDSSISENGLEEIKRLAHKDLKEGYGISISILAITKLNHDK